MKSRIICGSFLLILLVAFATGETVETSPEEEKQVPLVAEITKNEETPIEKVSESLAEKPKGETGDIDYESALRPATLKKRSISNIIKLLLGGNVQPNHPLVKQPEEKTWSIASNILAALPGGAAHGGLGGHGSGWGSSSAAEQLAHLFQTKARIIPYTGQVASGLTGIASVKGDILKQIHSLSTQVIAQAAAEAAARAVTNAAAAHAVTHQVANLVGQAPHAVQQVNQAVYKAKAQALKPIVNTVNNYAYGAQAHGHGHSHGGRFRDYHQGWHSTQQNAYVAPISGGEKTPSEQAGPPYYSAQTAQVQTVQPLQQYQSNSLINQGIAQAMNQYQNSGYQSQYVQQPTQNQNQYTYAAYQGNNADARQSINNDYSTLAQNQDQFQTRPGPTIPLPGGTQLQVSAGPVSSDQSGRNAKEPPSILSSLATLITASTSAYNALNAFADPAARAAATAALASNSNVQSIPQASTNSFISQQFQPNNQQLGQRAPAPQAPLYSGSQSGSSSSQRPIYPADPYRGSSSAYVQQSQYNSGSSQHQHPQQQQAYSTSNNPSSSPFSSQYYPNNAPQYSSQTSGNTQYANSVPGASFGHGGGNPGGVGSGYSGNYGGARPSSGYAGGFGPQPAGSSPFQTTRSPGYGGNNGHPSQTPGNFNSPSGAFATPPGGFNRPTSSPFSASGPNNYPTSQNSYTPNFISPQQQQSSPSAYNGATGINSTPGVGSQGQTNSFSGNRNSYINPPPQQLYQSSSSEQINKYELPSSTGGHSQYNRNNNNQDGVGLIKKTKTGLIPNPNLTNRKTNTFVIASSSSDTIPSDSKQNENVGNNKIHHDDGEKHSKITVHFNPHDDENPISFEQYDDIIIAKVPEHKKIFSPPLDENRWTDNSNGQGTHKLHTHNPDRRTSDTSQGSEILRLQSDRTSSETRGKFRIVGKSGIKHGESSKEQSVREDGPKLPEGYRAKPTTVYSTLPEYLFGEDERRELFGLATTTIGGTGRGTTSNSLSNPGQKILGATSRGGKNALPIRISAAIDESPVLINDNSHPLSEEVEEEY